MLAAWMEQLKRSTGFTTPAPNTTSKFWWMCTQWRIPRTGMITVEKRVMSDGSIQTTSSTGHGRHQDGMVTGTLTPRHTTILISAALIGVSKFMKLFCKDGAHIAHSTLSNQSMSHKTNQLLKFYKHFTNNLENWFKNILQTLGLWCTTLRSSIGESGTGCSEMTTWTMSRSIFIGTKLSLLAKISKMSKMRATSTKPRYRPKLMVWNTQFGLVNGLWPPMSAHTGLVDSTQQTPTLSIHVNGSTAQLHTWKPKP